MFAGPLQRQAPLGCPRRGDGPGDVAPPVGRGPRAVAAPPRRRLGATVPVDAGPGLVALVPPAGSGLVLSVGRGEDPTTPPAPLPHTTARVARAPCGVGEGYTVESVPGPLGHGHLGGRFVSPAAPVGGHPLTDVRPVGTPARRPRRPVGAGPVTPGPGAGPLPLLVHDGRRPEPHVVVTLAVPVVRRSRGLALRNGLGGRRRPRGTRAVLDGRCPEEGPCLRLPLE